MSNRISWFFDLKGPSVSLDTACSSSMVALHLGCQSLKTGESEISIIGGTNLMLIPDIMTAMTSLHFLSPDGKCHSFDQRANGYSRGEGAAVVILKPLHLALRDNDVIRAVIRNSGVNQDGNTPGITLPSADAQEALIRQTYDGAGLSFADTGYVEAHGTGTPAGDSVEARALANTFGSARAHGDPVYVGSLKTNIGHLEGGSGLAQVVKAVFALEKGEIPPSLWFENANRRIPLDEWRLAVPTKLIPWPKSGLRRVSINSFGYGGTNAHCILDDAYHYLKERRLKGSHNTKTEHGAESPTSSTDSGILVTPPALDEITSLLPKELTGLGALDYFSSYREKKRSTLFAWSSHEQLGVARTANIYADYLTAKEEAGVESHELLERLALTLSARRSILPWKSFVVASNLAELKQKLLDLSRKPTRSSKPPKLAFVFTGQGAQWFAMGRELCVHQIFRESLEAASAYLVSMGCLWSLLHELLQDESSSNINNAALSQPLCTAVQVALVDLLRHWGVKPSAVVGHSSGEIAAAYAKGAITRQDAWLISYHRGRLSGSIRGLAPHLNGAMMAVGLGPVDVQKYLDKTTEGKVVIACINSQSSTTLSGNASTIKKLESMIQADGHFARQLKVETAYHSPHMKVIAKLYLDSLSHLTPTQTEDNDIKMFSSVTAEPVKSAELGASYWVANLLSPVNFLGAVQTLCSYSEGGKSTRRAAKPYADVMMEVGPHAALQGPLKQILNANPKTAQIPYLSVLRRGTDANSSALEAVGDLFTQGYPVDIVRVNDDHILPRPVAHLVDLPPFAWNRQNKYWYDSSVADNHRFRKHPRKDLLGSRMMDGLDNEPRWRNILRLSEVPWMEGHKVQGSILYPAAGMMIAAIEAAKQVADTDKEIEGFELRDVLIGKAIVIPADDPGVETILSLRPWRMGSRASTSIWQEFALYTSQEGWDKNCSGLIRVVYKEHTNPLFIDENQNNAQRMRKAYFQTVEECSEAQNPRQFYDHLSNIGLQYGEIFQNLLDVKDGQYKSACVIRIPDTRSQMPMGFEYDHVIHPTTLDNMIQMALPASTSLGEKMTMPKVPVSIDKLYISADVPSSPGTLLQGFAIAEVKGFDEAEADVAVSTANWNKPLVTFEKIKSKAVTNMLHGAAADAEALRKLTSYLHWQEDISMLSQEETKAICTGPAQKLDYVEPNIIAELELGAFIFMKRLLATITPEEVKSCSPHMQTFYEYMERTYDLVAKGQLAHQSAFPDIDWLNTTPEFEDELLARVAKSSTDGAVMYQHGINLVEIFRGTVPPLQALMENNLLHNFYADGVGCSESFSHSVEYIRLLAHKNPNMRILEIGAGTGGSTLPILEKLGGHNGTSPLFSNYTFTDISSGFFEKAREKLKCWTPFMTYARLNIEEDPLSQGFSEDSYDLIIATNVLHATRFMGDTLANVHKLLKPTGKLVLNEITNSLLRVHMIVGSLEGWWLGAADSRKWGPTLTEDEWHDVLKRSGFTGLDIAMRDFESERDRMYSIMVSSASAPEILSPPAENLIVVPKAPGDAVTALSTALTRKLKQGGADVTVVTIGDILAIERINNKSCLALLECDEEKPFLPEIGTEAWEALQKLILQSADITWVSRGGTNSSEAPFANLMSGMARSIRAENPQVAFTTLDLDYNATMSSERIVDLIVKIFSTGGQSKNNSRPDWEYAVRDGRALVQRILPEKAMNDLITTSNLPPKAKMAPFKQPGRPLTLSVGTLGRLDTLQFVDDPSTEEPLAKNEVEIEVKGIGLNFKDIMVSMGQLQEPALGLECSGTISRAGSAVQTLRPGDRVMTWRLGAFSNFLRNPETMVQKIPDDMNFVTAASLPMVYSTAYYGLYHAARLLPGETILIHGAAGGVGQAAIILAQHIGAEIFATVSSEEKKALLTEKYGIAEDHIFNSRDTQFAQGVMRMTNNRGVDVVLNSLAGEPLRQSWHCIAWFGRFVEMGQKDIGKHVGKIVLEPAENDLVPCLPAKAAPYKFKSDATYVLAGGSGGLGRFIGRWMVKQGAKHVVFLSRSGERKPEMRETVEMLRKQGAKVAAYPCDVSSEADMRAALDRCEKEFPPVRGVIQGAMVLKDAIFQNMSHEQYMAAVGPKVQGSWNLHTYLPKDMDFFVLLSSVAGIAGSRGQGNYSAGNAFQDALAHHRRLHGMHGVCIDVGMVLGVGFLAESTEDRVHENTKMWNFTGIREKELLDIIQAAMMGESIQGQKIPPQLITGLSTGGMMAHSAQDYPWWFNEAKFSHIVQVDTHQVVQTENEDSAQLKSLLAEVTNMDAASDIVCEALMAKLAKSMMVAVDDIENSRPVSSYGVDSLLAVELRGWVFTELQADISVFDLLSNVPISTLSRQIAAKSKCIPEGVVEADA
ncbi:hypothetical protein BBP40_005855 [Aspergillus hancockii]|nr:hypothetical protein BBP40_005855 [Aspergillus hancockii]